MLGVSHIIINQNSDIAIIFSPVMLNIDSSVISVISLVPSPYIVIGIDATVFAIAIISMKYMYGVSIRNIFDIRYSIENRIIHPNIEIVAGISRYFGVGMSWWNFFTDSLILFLYGLSIFEWNIFSIMFVHVFFLRNNASKIIIIISNTKNIRNK